MPLALDPEQTVPISLEVDKAKPDATRPAFLCRFLTKRKMTRVLDLLKQAQATDDYDAAHKVIDEALNVGIVGWRNIAADGKPIPFAPDAYDEVLTGTEKFELAQKQISETRLAEHERKNSSSPAPTAQAGSAAPAETLAPADRPPQNP
jgi:hypothetical protein